MIALARIVEHLQNQASPAEMRRCSKHYAREQDLHDSHLQPLLLITGAGGHFCAGADIRLPAYIRCTPKHATSRFTTYNNHILNAKLQLMPPQLKQGSECYAYDTCAFATFCICSFCHENLSQLLLFFPFICCSFFASSRRSWPTYEHYDEQCHPSSQTAPLRFCSCDRRLAK